MPENIISVLENMTPVLDNMIALLESMTAVLANVILVPDNMNMIVVEVGGGPRTGYLVPGRDGTGPCRCLALLTCWHAHFRCFIDAFTCLFRLS